METGSGKARYNGEDRGHDNKGSDDGKGNGSGEGNSSREGCENREDDDGCIPTPSPMICTGAGVIYCIST